MVIRLALIVIATGFCLVPTLVAQTPSIVVDPVQIGDPTWLHPGVEGLVDVSIENVGDADLYYTFEVIEDNGPTGWLYVSGLSGMVECGINNLENGYIVLNAGGIITETGNYYGRIHFEGNDPVNLPLDIEVELIVADTIYFPKWDTIGTSCMNLTIANNGNSGREGYGKVNLDYYDAGDCDTTAKVYLYDGSPLVGMVDGNDTVVTSAIWGKSFTETGGFRPLGNTFWTKGSIPLNVLHFETGTIVTQDSTIALEKIWLASQDTDNCHFIIQHTRFWSHDGLPHQGITVGELVDWDIPWDYLPDDINQERTAINTGGVDLTRNLLFQLGYEAYGAGSDTSYPYNCQYNDARFGGIAFVEAHLNSTLLSTNPYGGFIGETDILKSAEGCNAGPMYALMTQPGLASTDSTEDLHSVMCYVHDLDLGPEDVLEVVTVIASGINPASGGGVPADLTDAVDAAVAWYLDWGGMDIFNDVDGDGHIDIDGGGCLIKGDINGDFELTGMDMVYFVYWLWNDGPEPPLIQQVDADGSGEVTAMDLVYLVNYLWNDGPPPVPCPFE